MEKVIEETDVKMPIFSLNLVEACKLYGNYFENLSAEKIEEMVKEYKMFWRIIKKNPGMSFTPSKSIDQVWHLHMLHPQNYFADSKGYFNGILSHSAGFGKKEGELEKLKEYAKIRDELWFKEYGYYLK
ncbi:glycine-rich domain-containing protein-like (plasmid) [Macrococcus psychrotolerans]|nr:glycine-rich domain-containing protein-like [Macrococcus caseolyticus]QYA77702.1 glycine-rich domain-containing protein-like [Macrococcus caseolyticus]